MPNEDYYPSKWREFLRQMKSDGVSWQTLKARQPEIINRLIQFWGEPPADVTGSLEINKERFEEDRIPITDGFIKVMTNAARGDVNDFIAWMDA